MPGTALAAGDVEDQPSTEDTYDITPIKAGDPAPFDGILMTYEAASKIAVDKKSFLYLVGTTLEYSGGLNGKGFVFNNPNANRTCGCGESFSL